MERDNLFSRLLKDVAIRPYSEGNAETKTGDDSPTGKPIIYINNDTYAGKAKEKMVKAEALHLLKHKEPKLHRELYEAANRDPAYKKWAQDSYRVVTGQVPDPETGERVPEDKREKRDFEKWHKESRFDQVIGGYIMAGDPDIPTMRFWDRDNMRIGPELRGKFEKVRKEFDSYSFPRLGQPPKLAR